MYISIPVMTHAIPMPVRMRHSAAHILTATLIPPFPKLFTYSGRGYTLSKVLEESGLEWMVSWKAYYHYGGSSL